MLRLRSTLPSQRPCNLVLRVFMNHILFPRAPYRFFTNRAGGGGGNNNYGGGGGTRGGGASNPYANRSGGGNSNSGPVQRQSQDSVYVPISALNPYQNRWTIKAR